GEVRGDHPGSARGAGAAPEGIRRHREEKTEIQGHEARPRSGEALHPGGRVSARLRGVLARAAVAALLLLPFAAPAQTLYGSGLRSFANEGGQIVVGNLFTINLGDGSTQLLARIRLDNGIALGITGLAVHPSTGVFYGITSKTSPQYPQSLVEID